MKTDLSPLATADNVVAYAKPPGLPTTGRDLDDPDCLQAQIMDARHAMVWALHQLDKDTSGVVLFATRKEAVATWQKRWAAGTVKKSYLAMVHNTPGPSPQIIDAPLRALDRRGYTQVVVDADRGRRARTHVEQLSTAGPYSLVLARPLTGRTHQIRVHLQHIGCPLIGEKRYNAIPCAHHDRHALHALAIDTNQAPPLDHIEATLPDDLRRLAQKLAIPLPDTFETRRGD